MNNSNYIFKKNGFKFLSMLAILVGMSGAILFFPINMDEKYTCIFERIVPYSRVDRDNSAVSVEGVTHLESVVLKIGNDSITPKKTSPFHHYISSYSIWWWGSLALLGLGAYKLSSQLSHKNVGKLR
ncbi:MAG: hypothetical protein HQ508_04060 [Candidatus Marinimicrobia bacterium]|nr:hypothetical protein [Candidatus Neomarinimicrobiota bacterium]